MAHQATYKVQPDFIIERSTDGESVDLFLCPLKLKHQSKTVGVARQQLHFLCSDKENEAKESLALRWACLGREDGNLNSGQTIRLSFYISPAGTESLESLSFCEGLQRPSFSLAFPL